MRRDMSEQTPDYKDTLNLPKTDFPMRANAVQREVKLQEKCTDRVYRWQLKNNSATQPFILHDGPPYANGLFFFETALSRESVCHLEGQIVSTRQNADFP